MNIVVAGGCFRLSPDQLSRRQAPPEENLAAGLAQLGHDVRRMSLEAFERSGAPRDADIVHIHHLSKAAMLAAVSSSITPFVFTAHGTSRRESLRQRMGLKVVQMGMSAGVCLSNAEREEILGARPRLAQKLWVIPNGMGFPTRTETSERPDRNSCRRLLFVGQLIELKRVEWALQFVAQDSRCELRIVFHNDRLLEALRRLSSELGVNERVTFVGQLSGSALFDEYRSADLLVLPSRTEAMPSVIVEALSVGTPVVAGSVGAVPELVSDAGTIFRVDSQTSFEDAMKRSLLGLERLQRRASARSAAIRAEFSIERMVALHEQLYVTTLRGRTR